MAKFTKSFRGVKNGEIYPTDFVQGDDCPKELEAGAKACGALNGAVQLTAGEQFVSGKAADVIASLNDEKDVDLLKEALAAEAGGQRSRQTVVDAITAAIAVLSQD
ncbi:hypothetical protein BJI69_14315 [Luteibacter rhizovicinus DSM 16549]|uniref:Uncharacterized protein n=1 Tax=Luteibacter rhizovicinus DSM 16549 TaxID=1440763 RepID=A0A1L3EVA7_9GAMM|nr:hypothetical protein [Luteibacter rhizovicinus]APG04950.1 hypothetical protein BJI69_14315 [Luteibacter rhizovicinus DSM 16549]